MLTLTDGRLGEGNFITQSLLLLVEDINDNVPIFRPHVPSLTLREDAKPRVLTTVEATDADLGAHGQVVYYLQELDGDNNVFSISTVNGKGVIRLVGSLDYERKYLYQLRILAVDRAINEKVRYIYIKSLLYIYISRCKIIFDIIYLVVSQPFSLNTVLLLNVKYNIYIDKCQILLMMRKLGEVVFIDYFYDNLMMTNLRDPVVHECLLDIPNVIAGLFTRGCFVDKTRMKYGMWTVQ